MNAGKQVTIFLFFLLSCQWMQSISAQGHYEITDESKEIYRLITELRFDEAMKSLHIEKKTDPENLFLYHLDNYIDFFSILIYEDPTDFNKRKKLQSKKLKKLKSGDSADPYYRLVQAEFHLQWAISRLKFGEYFSAVRETQKAYNLLEENQEMFPNFALNYKGMAIVHAVIGTLPDNYLYLVEFLTGLKGDINKSIREINLLINFCEKDDHIFLNEANVIYSFIELYLNNNPDRARQIIRDANLDTKNSPLACFVVTNIAQRTGKTDEAIQTLVSFKQDADQKPFLFLDFMLGINLLRKLDPAAKTYLLTYATQFGGQNYIKEAYQLLAWYSLVIENNEDLAKYYYGLCLNKGNTLVDEDKSAYKEAKSGILPNPLLLKIRLLFDGAYYKKSLQLIEDNSFELIQKHPLEYHYRLARNQQKLNNNPNALHAYKKVLEMDSASKTYQQCNAALQSAIIYENNGKIELAQKYYSKCLSLDPDKYKNSLHQKAKAGLNRLGD